MLKIALFSPSLNNYSETFIRAHIEGIEGVSHVYHGGELPLFENNQKIKALSKWKTRIKNILHQTAFSPQQWGLIQSIKSKSIDLIFIEYGTTAAKNFDAICFLNIPFIIHFHGFDISIKSILAQHEACYRKMLPKASKIIVVSKTMEQKVINLGARKEQTIYTPCGANESFNKIVKKDNLNTFISVGRFVEKKGPLYTIIAFHQILKKFPFAKLKMIGDGPLITLCRDYIQFHQLEHHISLLGSFDPDKVALELSDALCFVQHSITAENGDQEGTPVALLEAMLAGLPVISTFHAGISDIVQENMGVLVKERDIEDMKTAMEKALEHPENFAQLGLNGKNFILQNHLLKHHLEKINAAIRQIR